MAKDLAIILLVCKHITMSLCRHTNSELMRGKTMRFIRRICWQFLGALVTLIHFLRRIGVIVLAFMALRQTGLILDIASEYNSLAFVRKKEYVFLLVYIVGALGLHFLKQSLLNAKELIKDKIMINTKYHFSKEKIDKFKNDMFIGNFDPYTFDEIYAMSQFLEERGEKLVTNYNSRAMQEFNARKAELHKEHITEEDGETHSFTGNSDEEKVISTRELNGFTHKGVSDPTAALEELIGLSNVKEQVKKMQNRYIFERKRMESGTSTELSTCNHMCFIGPAGTGKTSVARIMSSILYDLKIIRKNQVVEVNGTDLMGQYLGYTAKRTKRIIEAAKGGVLFVDEAYTLSSGNNSYADEALGELVKAMEDYKDDLVVIFAGYGPEMSSFLEQNSGMKSRIKSYIYFSNYSPEELGEIFASMAKKANFTVTKELLETYKDFALKVLLRDASFGNARTVRKNLDEMIEKHADNYAMGRVSEDMINVLSIEDFPYFAKDNN